MDYIQEVPEHCDRIVWRGSYYHLPLVTPSTVLLHDEITRLQADNKRLEAECQSINVEARDAALGLNDYFGLKLAACQLENRRLLETIKEVLAEGKTEYIVELEALSTPTNTDTLTAYRNSVLENFLYKFRRHVGGDGEFWLHELDCFYEDMKNEIQE